MSPVSPALSKQELGQWNVRKQVTIIFLSVLTVFSVP